MTKHMSESGEIRGRWRGVATIFALVLLLAMLVGLIVYQFEEKIGGLAYFLGEAIATIIVIGLLAWSAYRRQA
jgi:high-affinity Fe2+/Pb2+ permease